MKKMLKKYLLTLTTLTVVTLMLLPGHTLAQDDMMMACESDVVVQADDWLSKIADKVYGDVLSYPAIVAGTNSMAATDDSYATIDNADVIEPGWKLCIPAAADAEAYLGAAMDSMDSEGAMAMGEDRGILRVRHDLTYGGSENMDPADSSRFWPVTVMVFDRLAAPSAELRPSPSLATSWESNEAGNAWTFHLRDDVTFHDGSPLTSADVAYSIDHWVNSETSLLATTLAIVESVDTPDDYTVVVNLNQTHVDFPVLVMDYRALVMPKDGLAEILTTGRGSGPFILEKLDVEGTTILVSNDNYWGGSPGVKQVEVAAIPDAEAAAQALLAGQTDWDDLTAQQAVAFDGNAAYNVEQIPSGNWSGLVMRTDIEPFDNVPLRKAMRVVADRQLMVDLALSGAGTVSCDTPVMPGDPYKFETDCFQDIELAKTLLTEAGYPDGIEVTLYTSDVCADWGALNEIYQQNAALAGINIEIQQLPTDGFWTDAWMVQPFVTTCWNERQADQALNEIYRSGGAWNESYWNREDYDALLDSARSELDFDARKAHYVAAQELLWEEGGTLIPYHSNIVRVTKSCVDGIADIGAFLLNWNTITKDASCE